MKNYLLITVLIFSLAFAGCRSNSPAVQTVVRETEYIETVRDSTIVIPADSSWLKALLECDSAGNVLMKQLAGYNAGSNVRPPRLHIEDNVLTALCEVDSFAVYFNWVQKYGIIREKIKVPVEVPVEIPVRGWIWWVGFVTIIAASALALGFVIWKIPLLKWIKTIIKLFLN